MRRMILIAAIAASLSGCATRPQLYALPPLPKLANDAPQQNVAAILDRAEAVQKDYGNGYHTAALWTDISSLPLIGAATAVAAIVFDAGKHQRKRVGFIGIGAGAYSATRAVLLPAGTSELFARGHAALGCIRAEGPLFVGPPADRMRANQSIAEASLDGALANASSQYGSADLVGKTSEDQPKRFAAALKALSDAMTVAATARDASAKESAAYENAAGFFGGALSDVIIRVATKGREGRSVDYEALKAQLIANLPPAAAPAGAADLGAKGLPDNMLDGFGKIAGNKTKETAAQKEAREIAANNAMIAQLYVAANSVTAATRILTGATPKFTDSLNRVQVCPSKV